MPKISEAIKPKRNSDLVANKLYYQENKQRLNAMAAQRREAKRAAKLVAASMTATSVRLPLEMLRDLKIHAATHGQRVNDLLLEGIRHVLSA